MPFKFTIIPAKKMFMRWPSNVINVIVQNILNYVNALPAYKMFPKDRKIQIKHDEKEVGSIGISLDFIYIEKKFQKLMFKEIVNILNKAGLSKQYGISEIEFSFGKETHLVSINGSSKLGIYYGASYFPDAPEDVKLPIDVVAISHFNATDTNETAHNKLVQNCRKIIGGDMFNFGYFFKLIEAKDYAKALQIISVSKTLEAYAIVECMLEGKEILKININEQGEMGWTALHNAARSFNIDIYNKLIESGAHYDLKDLSGKTSVDIIKSLSQVVTNRSDMTNANSVVQLSKKLNETSIKCKPSNDSAQKIEEDQNNNNKFGNDKKDNVSNKSEVKSKVEVKNEQVNSSNELALLLKETYRQNDVSMLSIGKALRYACAKNHYYDLPLLLSTGVDINGIEEKSFNKKTPLHWAVSNDSLECAEILLKSSAKVDLKDNGGKTAKELAEKSKNPKMQELFGIQKVADNSLQPKNI